MQIQGKARRVSIYIGEDDHYQGAGLYMALLEFLKREGASGATVTRGLAGLAPTAASTRRPSSPSRPIYPSKSSGSTPPRQ
jgi:PII-like signaling protein